MNLTSMFDDVGLFHVKMGLPVALMTADSEALAATRGYPALKVVEPQLLSQRDFEYRTAFLWEELREFVEAYGMRDLARMADAMADLVWIALGTSHYMGVPMNAIWSEVRRANLEKRPWREGDPIKPRNVVGLEVVKPQGWVPPRVFEAINDAINHHTMRNLR